MADSGNLVWRFPDAAWIVCGPVITLAAIAWIEALDGFGVPVLLPGAVLLAAVVLATILGGLTTGLLSGAISVAYTVYMGDRFAQGGAAFAAAHLALIMVIAVIAVAFVRDRLLVRAEARAADAAALSKRLMEDIARRRDVEERLQALNETLELRVAERTAVAESRAVQLRGLTLELTQAEQAERRRLAQLLHDDLQQRLAAAKKWLGIALGRVRTREDPAESLDQVRDLLSQSIESMRTLSAELSPPVLHDAGLAAALEWLARWENSRNRLTLEVRADPDAEPTAENIRAFLFQAVRELLDNVAAHSGVKRASVASRRDGGMIEITVEDKGKGFDPMAAAGDARNKRFGLFSIQQRLEFLGGRTIIDTAPGRGTRVTLRAPIGEPIAAPALSVAPAPGPRPPNGRAPNPLPVAAAGVIRVLVADDHALLREGLTGVLHEHANIRVIGHASDGSMAVELTRRLHPDVVVMDIAMPGMSGIDATRHITHDFPGVSVIGLSMHEKEDMAAAMHDAGAFAYLSKGGPSEPLIAAIEHAKASHAPAAPERPARTP
jgi:signal transduction histidine kinase/ActR/RegA family two-component response regulator